MELKVLELIKEMLEPVSKRKGTDKLSKETGINGIFGELDKAFATISLILLTLGFSGIMPGDVQLSIKIFTGESLIFLLQSVLKGVLGNELLSLLGSNTFSDSCKFLFKRILAGIIRLFLVSGILFGDAEDVDGRELVASVFTVLSCSLGGLAESCCD